MSTSTETPISVAEAKRRLQPGTTYDMTNHYITREDHPCYGTRRRTVDRITGSHLYLVGERWGIPWPKGGQAAATDDGAVLFYGHPKPGDLFLTFRPAEQ